MHRLRHLRKQVPGRRGIRHHRLCLRRAEETETGTEQQPRLIEGDRGFSLRH